MSNLGATTNPYLSFSSYIDRAERYKEHWLLTLSNQCMRMIKVFLRSKYEVRSFSHDERISFYPGLWSADHISSFRVLTIQGGTGCS